VVSEFGDGRDHGVRLDYSFDGPVLLGTGGALRRALPQLGPVFFVLYGDSYLTTPFQPVAEFFLRSGRLGLMTVYRNEGLYDTSNVVFRGGEIAVYEKRARLPEMRHIDYGLSLFRAQAFQGWSEGEKFDLADVMTKLVAQKQLAGFEVPDRFYEIGSHAGLQELEALLSSRPQSSR
jgi:NDP-sugar pyrophosphorylase family protein